MLDFLIRRMLYPSLGEERDSEDKEFKPSFESYKNKKYFSLLVNETGIINKCMRKLLYNNKLATKAHYPPNTSFKTAVVFR